MKFDKIKSKLFVFVVVVFLTTTLCVLTLSHFWLIKIIDASQNDIYYGKIEAILGYLETVDAKLKKTGLVDAYIDDFKTSAAGNLRSNYYKDKAQPIYPFIIDKKGTIVLHPVLPNGDLTWKDNEIIKAMRSSGEGSFYAKHHGEKSWCIFREFANWGWIIGYIVPEKIKYLDLRQFEMAIVATMIGIVILLFYPLHWIVTNFTKPLVELTKISKQIAGGDFDQKIEIKSSDELGTLSRNFSYMQDAIRQQINNLEALNQKNTHILKVNEQQNQELKKEIQNRRQTEKELRASEEKFYKAFNLNPNTLAIIDLETKQRLAVNDYFSELVGYSKKELMENPLGALGEINLEKVELAIETIKQGGSLRDIEVKLKNKNGTERLMLYSVDGIEVDNRNCMIVSGKDITNRKKAEEDLLISETRYRNLFQNAPIPLWEEDITDVYKLIEEFKEKGVRNFRKHVDANPSFLEKCSQKVKILDVNQEAMKLHHANTKDELLGNLDKIFTEKSFDTFKEEIISLFEGFLQFESEGEVKTLSGKKKSIHIKMIIEKEKDERYKALLATIDISDRKQWEEKLRQAQKMESIGSLAGGIAHDFNNLLFPIIGISEMLLEDLPKDSLEYENATEIFHAGKRAGDLVQQILAFSRRSEHKMTPVLIQNILKEVLKLSRSTIPSNIEIQQNIQQNCGLVMADPTQIHQVAMNLITNAFHAVEEKNGVIDIELKEIELKEKEIPDSELKGGQYIKLSVSDNGTGISRNTMHKIFEPYFTTKEQGKGTGLGLAVVYGIIKEHEGEIKVYSEIGKGATFNVYLPLMKKNNKIEKRDKSVGMPTGSERILLVDDEVSIAKLEGQMLSRLGYQVTIKTNSLDALNTFRSDPDSFDLVISDMTMPDMTGDQLSKDILSLKPDTPIIICTGFSERINKERAEMLGVKGFLMKPVGKSEMAQMIRKILDEAIK